MVEASIPHVAKVGQEMAENAGGFTSQGLSAAASLLAKQAPKSKSLNKATKMLRTLNEAYAIHRHFTSNGCAKWLAELKLALESMHNPRVKDAQWAESLQDPLMKDDPWAGQQLPDLDHKIFENCDREYDPWSQYHATFLADGDAAAAHRDSTTNGTDDFYIGELFSDACVQTSLETSDASAQTVFDGSRLKFAASPEDVLDCFVHNACVNLFVAIIPRLDEFRSHCWEPIDETNFEAKAFTLTESTDDGMDFVIDCKPIDEARCACTSALECLEGLARRAEQYQDAIGRVAALSPEQLNSDVSLIDDMVSMFDALMQELCVEVPERTVHRSLVDIRSSHG